MKALVSLAYNYGTGYLAEKNQRLQNQRPVYFRKAESMDSIYLFIDVSLLFVFFGMKTNMNIFTSSFKSK